MKDVGPSNRGCGTGTLFNCGGNNIIPVKLKMIFSTGVYLRVQVLVAQTTSFQSLVVINTYCRLMGRSLCISRSAI